MYAETKQQALECIEKSMNEDMFPMILDTWSIGDVLETYVGYDDEPLLTNEQAAHVLTTVYKRYDASRGINWDRIAAIAEELYPRGQEDPK